MYGDYDRLYRMRHDRREECGVPEALSHAYGVRHHRDDVRSEDFLNAGHLVDAGWESGEGQASSAVVQVKV
jgi:hypothetical protein